MFRSNKPVGQPTRGKTASNRLRRVDNLILLYEPSLLTRTDGLFADSMFVDLGYGFDARTTLESASRFRRANPHLKVLGVEIEKDRVEAALPYSDPITMFRHGGFNIPLLNGESVRLIRAFNVLRQYEEMDFASAYARMKDYLLPGGLLVEGTSTPFGSVWSANLARRIPNVEDSQFDGWKFEALVFSTNFHTGFDVEEFQTILPKNYIHRVIKGQPIFDFFEAWKRSASETASVKTYGYKQWFIASAESLAAKGYKINLQRKFLSKGYLIWEL